MMIGPCASKAAAWVDGERPDEYIGVELRIEYFDAVSYFEDDKIPSVVLPRAICWAEGGR